MTDTNAGTIYLGDAIAHASERALLARLVELLERAGEPYILLANCQFGGRQIDCILATTRQVSVFEAKASRWPIQGGVNGDWSRRQEDGRLSAYPNAYLQTVHAKMALRDAMAEGGPLGRWYPDAQLIFTTGIPAGSGLPADDRKVRVRALDALDLGEIAADSPWTLDRWHAFARHHRLKRTAFDHAIAPPALQAAHDLLERFREAVRRDYRADGERWLAEDEAQAQAVRSGLIEGPGAYVSGPSGCGKTLLARRTAADLALGGATVLYLSGRLYDGSWQALIRREIALLSEATPAAIYRAARDTGAPTALILDGLNELPDAEEALRGLCALARRLDARLIVTGQGKQPPQLAGLHHVRVERPSLALKRRIAQAQGTLGAAAGDALAAAGSGFEASVIGAIAGKVEASASRQSLLDLFVRERLGPDARLGALGLRRLAADLQAAIAFSTSESSFDELMLAQNVPDSACSAMFATGLLVRRAGRVSFSHEILQLACAAHGLASAVERAPESWSKLLDLPMFEGIAGDVLSVVEGLATATAVLAASTRPALLRSAALGRHGAVARAAAEALLEGVYQDALAEIAGLALVVVPGERATVNWNPDSLRGWTEQERARLTALGLDLHSERGLQRHLALCGSMDARLHDERQRVYEEATAAGCRRLRSASFELAYYGFGRPTGFLETCRAMQRSLEEHPERIPDRQFDVRRLTSGQLHFYLENRYALVPETKREAFAEQLIVCIEERLRTEPYHVKQAILNAAGFARTASEDVNARLVAAVQGIEVALGDTGTNMAVVDALQFLGAIEDPDDAYRLHVRAELAVATDPHVTPQGCEQALMLAGAQFAHPYGHIYYEEIEQLPESARRALYRHALRADTRYCGNLAWLMRQVAAWEDPADGRLMQRFAQLPDPANPMSQEEWSAFVDATRFLGRHGIALEDQACEGDAARCLILVRALVHAAEDRDSGAARAASAWRALEAMPVGTTIGVLGEVQAALLESHWSERITPFAHLDLTAAYPDQCLALARSFLDSGAEPAYFHCVPFRSSGPQFAFHAIATYGDRSDLERLRAQSLGPHARLALETLKKLDLVVAG